MKDYIIWTKHGEGSSSCYTTGNPTNIDDKFQFVHEKHKLFHRANMLCQMLLIMVTLE
jgi:hypothetical protein